MKRHADFVSNYDVNFKELKNNIQALASSQNQESFNAAAEKTRNHFNKVKPPSKHQPLDTNNLPHRAAKPNKNKPRTNKKDFEKEYGVDEASIPRPIRVASVGDLTGVLPDLTEPIELSAPGIEHLARTPEVQLTEAIQAKA